MPKTGEIWEPKTQKFRVLDGIKAGIIYTADQKSKDYHAWLFTAPNGKVLHAGPSKRMNWIEPKRNRSTRLPARGGVDQINGNAVMYDIGKILIVGGAWNYYYKADGVRDAWVITLDEGSGDRVQVKRSRGSLHTGRTMCNSVVLPSGKFPDRLFCRACFTCLTTLAHQARSSSLAVEQRQQNLQMVQSRFTQPRFGTLIPNYSQNSPQRRYLETTTALQFSCRTGEFFRVEGVRQPQGESFVL